MSKMLLYDRYNRTVSNLRISVTDQCNLRCKYCVVSSDIPFQEKEYQLTFAEMKQIVEIFSSYGINRIRITGGEPLIRQGLLPFLSDIKKEFPSINLFMTTNGLLIKSYINELANSGISTINVSLDTLNPSKFKSITGSDKLQTVIEGIKLLKENTSINVKINCVSLRGFNESEIFDFIELADELDVIIRFIEFMPFTGNQWNKNQFISSKDLRKIIETKFTLIKETISHVSQTSRLFTVKKNNVKLGFISSVSESFCQWCNRIRITADGNLRTCLHGKNEINILKMLRSDYNYKIIEDAIKKAIYNKPIGHPEFLDSDYIIPLDDREMMRIGG